MSTFEHRSQIWLFNRDYLIQLADALRELAEDDQHVFAIERQLTDSSRK